MLGSKEQAVYFSQGTPELSIDVTPYAPGMLGKEVEVNVGTGAAPNFRYYKYVKAGGSVTPRAMLAWSSTTTIGSTVVVEPNASPTDDALFCGVSAADSTVSSGQYFWMVVYRPGTTFQGAHNIATNATFNSSGIFWVLSSGSLGTQATVFSTSQFTAWRYVAMNISSINSTSATSLTTTATSGYFIFM